MNRSFLRPCLLLLALWSAVVLTGCGGSKADAPGALAMTPAEQEAWEIRLVEHRIDKNEAYMNPADTPLQEADLPSFVGLNYYWPAPELRFRVPLVTTDAGGMLQLEKRKGQQVDYVRKGTVSFTHAAKVHTLSVFGPADTSQYGDYLWLPFYDATSGKETYGGGRYLDLELADDGTVELDFNFAYNPLCDYNPEQFNCTLPPAENTLDFPVTAGEKLFRLEE
ncbi:MAG TPA: DUF1684 domain-containing protein [Candidatus Krumholzibacteria bacterium]|nr:DUF1684 domain-containing protein [Candidatus Krumholzibacteria bacterium]